MEKKWQQGRSKESINQRNETTKARRNAKQQLVKRHREEFQILFDQEKKKLNL